MQDDDGKPRLRETWPLRKRQAIEVVAIYAVLVGVWTAAGKLLTGPLDDSSLVRRDERIANWFVERRTATWDDLSLVGSWLSETIVKIGVTALLGMLMLWLFRRWLEALVLALPLAVEAAVFLTVTLIVRRPRPDVPRLDSSPVSSSFPSGHVAAAAVYGTLAVVVFWHTRHWWARIAVVVVTAAVPVVVAFARMYRGMHFASDVIAGAVLGIASAVLVTLVLVRSPQGREALGDDAATSPEGAPGNLDRSERPAAVTVEA